MVGEGTREAEVVGLNPSNVEKNRTRTYSCIFFIHAANIYFSTQKNDARHLCVDIGDGLRIP